jgi:hypothetical protein
MGFQPIVGEIKQIGDNPHWDSVNKLIYKTIMANSVSPKKRLNPL